MQFMNKDGESETVPYVLHCSPSGAIERVMYSLLERTWFQEKRGETPHLPLWLAPTQVRFIPVNPERHLERCEELAGKLHSSRVRADIADEHETIGKRIRDASREWVPYIVVVGDRDLEGDEVTVRIRGQKDQVQMSVDGLVKEIQGKTEGMPWKPLPLPRLISKRPAFRG